jgi:hypothetical protein
MAMISRGMSLETFQGIMDNLPPANDDDAWIQKQRDQNPEFDEAAYRMMRCEDADTLRKSIVSNWNERMKRETKKKTSLSGFLRGC